jgi:hypothetical protein
LEEKMVGTPETGRTFSTSGVQVLRLAVLALLVVWLAGLLSGCCGVLTAIETGLGQVSGKPKAVLEWDPAPGNVVMQAARPIQHYQPSISPWYSRNYIPEGRVFGDGRVVWTGTSNGARVVLEGRLTPAEMTALLQQFLDAGFFAWDTSYFSWLPYDNPLTDYLTVRLRSGPKTVSVSMVEPPNGFRDLFSTLNSGAGAAGTPFQPQQATLMAVKTSDAAQYDWDAENFNLDLSQAASGIPVEGRALQMAWDVVNQNPFFPPPVRLNGSDYKLYVLVPGLMY